MALLTDYTSLVTSEHSDQPNFMAFVSAFLQPAVDIINLLSGIPQLFDLDTAVGSQLDDTGLWIGRSRNVLVPLTGVYFSLDTPNLGFNQGVWLGPYDSSEQVIQLPDDIYRIVLYAVIAANNWDGTIEGAYAVWAIAFNGLGYKILIQDNQDMTMAYILYLPMGTPAAVISLILSGVFDLRPAAVELLGYFVPSANGIAFALDVVNGPLLGGFDDGSWTVPLSY